MRKPPPDRGRLRNIPASTKTHAGTRPGLQPWNSYKRQTTLFLTHGLSLPAHNCYALILSPCLFNFCAEDTMRNAGLEEAQDAIKTARRNINNLRYADDTTPIAEVKEELKRLLIRMKESEKAGLKLGI